MTLAGKRSKDSRSTVFNLIRIACRYMLCMIILYYDITYNKVLKIALRATCIPYTRVNLYCQGVYTEILLLYYGCGGHRTRSVVCNANSSNKK